MMRLIFAVLLAVTFAVERRNNQYQPMEMEDGSVQEIDDGKDELVMRYVYTDTQGNFLYAVDEPAVKQQIEQPTPAPVQAYQASWETQRQEEINFQQQAAQLAQIHAQRNAQRGANQGQLRAQAQPQVQPQIPQARTQGQTPGQIQAQLLQQARIQKQKQELDVISKQLAQLSLLAAPGFRIAGLQNVNANCYMNSSLQALFHMQPLIALCRETQKANQDPNSPISQFLATFDGTSHAFHHLRAFVQSHSMFASGAQDASEFLGHFIDWTFGGEQFKQLMYTKIRWSLFCEGNCSNVIPTAPAEDSIFLNLSLPTDESEFDLATRLEMFFQPEVAPDDFSFQCSVCQHKRVVRVASVERAPKILFLSLLRFKQGTFQRMNNPVKIPEQISLPTEGSPTLYQLHSVINHTGGHYNVLIRDFTSGKWFLFDDSRVVVSSLGAICKKQPYIIIYQQQGIK